MMHSKKKKKAKAVITESKMGLTVSGIKFHSFKKEDLLSILSVSCLVAWYLQPTIVVILYNSYNDTLIFPSRKGK